MFKEKLSAVLEKVKSRALEILDGFKDTTYLRQNVVNIVFFLFVAALGILFYTLPNKPTVSEREKRELTQRPEFSLSALLDGSYTSEYAVYFADNFPFRETLINISQQIKSFAGTTNSDGVQIVDVNNNDDTAVENFDEERVSSSDLPDLTDIEDPDAAFEDAEKINESLFVAGDTVLTLAYQTKSVARNYVLAVNTFAEVYPEVQVHCAVLPIASAFYLPEKYRTDGTDQLKMIEYIYERLDDNVNAVDVYSNLAHHADEYIYFRTDHHWTGLGAYYAYCAFVESQDMEPMDISNMQTVVYENYLGTLYDKVGGNDAMRENPDTVIAYDIDAYYQTDVEYWVDKDGAHQTGPLIIKNLENDNKYMVFTNGDWRFVKITTQNQTGKKILVFKDSFGNAFVPYLVENYDEIYVADPRYSLPSIYSLIKNKGITDVLFITNISNTSVEQRVKEYLRLYYI